MEGGREEGGTCAGSAGCPSPFARRRTRLSIASLPCCCSPSVSEFELPRDPGRSLIGTAPWPPRPPSPPLPPCPPRATPPSVGLSGPAATSLFPISLLLPSAQTTVLLSGQRHSRYTCVMEYRVQYCKHVQYRVKTQCKTLGPGSQGRPSAARASVP